MNSALMFSKASDEWGTPFDLFQQLLNEFHFDYDAAASKSNRKRLLYFGLDHADPKLRDALKVQWDEWGDSFFLNPPYSKCREFIAKAAQEAGNGCTVVCLVPSRTDTRWWHEHVWDTEKHRPKDGVEVRFLKGRLRFIGGTNCAPFPSVIIVFRPRVEK